MHVEEFQGTDGKTESRLRSALIGFDTNLKRQVSPIYGLGYLEWISVIRGSAVEENRFALLEIKAERSHMLCQFKCASFSLGRLPMNNLVGTPESTHFSLRLRNQSHLLACLISCFRFLMLSFLT